MRAQPTPDAVLAELPGWQDASWCELDGGLSNRTFKLDKEGRSAVLKIDVEPRRAPYNTRRQEASVQTAAARAGLATNVLHVGDRIYLTEYVDGVVWSAATFAREGSLELLAAALRRLHALPPCGRSFDATFAARHYAGRIDRETAVAEACVNIIESTRQSRNVRLCHNDLVAENIISTPGIRFLDWEFARDNDPLFDLATIVEHHRLSPRQARVLLGAYYQEEGQFDESAFEDQCRRYRALLWLWLAARGDTQTAELDRLADSLPTSCS